jgi:cell division protein FtsL
VNARYNLQMLLALLVVAVLASAIGVVHARYRHRQLFTELSRLEKTRDALNIEFSRLQLEQATWAESNRIDKVARDRLGMKTPEPADIVVVRP